ncbi:MAG TPA: sulfatase [Planctomycetota bacterium]|nr:sulfatase [Planctomycetota bacterium]
MRVLFIDVDTLRPDHLGCYGYHRKTSPNIDRIAAQGVRFTNHYCSDAPCLPSRTALMTGRFGIHTGVVGHGGTAGDIRIEGPSRDFKDQLFRDSLPNIFRRAGCHTALISPFGERHTTWHFYAGFNEIHNTGKSGMESAEEVTPTILKWIDANGAKDNWFLYINYWDPHTPYRTPPDFGEPFAKDPLPDWITDEVLKKHIAKAGPHSAQDISMFHNKPNPKYPKHPGEIKDRASLRQMIDGYDNGIRYTDDHLGVLFDAFRKQGVFDDLAIVITGDHAENHGELGIYGEHATADHTNTNIPLIVRWPGMRAAPGSVDHGLHYNLDLGPTFADLTGQPKMERWDGQSFAGAITGAKTGSAAGRDTLVVSQCAHVCQRGVRFGPWMYVRTYHDGFHLFPGEMLFNIETDPHEQHDLAAQHPDVCREAVYRLNTWHDQMMSSMPHDVDPLWTVMKEGGPLHARGMLKQYIERLRESGRAYAIDELKRRHPREMV